MAFRLPELTSENFKAVALSFYDHSDSISMLDFETDLKRFQHVANLLARFTEERGNVRLLLNHVIILHNCFGIFTTIGLTFKTQPSDYPKLRAFLEFLSLIPEGHPLLDVEPDATIVRKLSEL